MLVSVFNGNSIRCSGSAAHPRPDKRSWSPPLPAYEYSSIAATACPINNSCLPRRAAPQNSPPASKNRNADADRGNWACWSGSVMQFTGPIEGLNACIHGTNVYQNMEYNFPWGQRIPGIYPKFRDYNYSINIWLS